MQNSPYYSNLNVIEERITHFEINFVLRFEFVTWYNLIRRVLTTRIHECGSRCLCNFIFSYDY